MRAYNPLHVDELGKGAVRALMDYPAVDLPPPDPIDGAGVYTIHYSGGFPAYAGLGDEAPIYVGKAEPQGKRQGRTNAGRASPVLANRLRKHSRSIDSAANLHLAEFQCRWLVLDQIWIGLAEQVLIAEYRPIWNVTVDGFGNNAPGAGRRRQARSQWDTLHPGREWAALLERDCPDTAADILAAIERHRTGKGTQ